MRMILAATLAVAPCWRRTLNQPSGWTKRPAVFSEIMSAPDKGIPEEMLAGANCIVIVPGLKKAAFIIGGKFGKVSVSCRNKGGLGWSAPGTVRIEGGIVGFQLGGPETDLVMLVMNARGVHHLLSSKFSEC